MQHLVGLNRSPRPVTACRADHCLAPIGFPAQNAMFCVLHSAHSRT